MADWAVGDMAQCVRGGPWLGWSKGYAVQASGPKLLSIHRVVEVQIGLNPAPPEPFLSFGEFPMRSYLHQHFRKVGPLEPDDDELVIAALRGEPAPEFRSIGRLGLPATLISESRFDAARRMFREVNECG